VERGVPMTRLGMTALEAHTDTARGCLCGERGCHLIILMVVTMLTLILGMLLLLWVSRTDGPAS